MQRGMARGFGVCALSALAATGAGAQAPPQSASLTLGGSVVLTLRATAGGMTPQQRVDVIDGRISDLLGTPDIKVSDVAVYTPVGKAPVIYALGRRLITVDATTAKAEGEGKTPLALAQMWARTLQQTLPRVNWRPSNEAEPVVPPHPPLTVTPDLSRVGGNVGLVTLRNKVVFKITGPQTGGLTAQERADMLTRRLQVAASRLSSPGPADISVAPAPADALPPAKAAPTDTQPVPPPPSADDPQQILVGTTPIITVESPQAKAAGFKSAADLAAAWAKNVRVALGLPPTVPTPLGASHLKIPNPVPPAGGGS